ncbi:MAG: lamin tail domain-containing protein [Candidatus Pacearchaeota archaeon]
MKIIKIIIFIVFIIFTPKSFGYSTDTHAALTQEIIDFYNQFFEKKISNSLKDFLIDGARREDDFPRYFNHFYDPVYDRGLNDKIWGKGISARIWAQDELKQKNIVYKVSQTIASILSAFQRRKIEDIEFETNYTWQKAINFYLNGDIEKAMFSLGHILHLIEDMGVPAHTRNDGHPAILGDEEIYEVWSDRFKQNNIKTSIKDNLKDKKPIILNSLDDYFINLSTYTNNNFFSNDTIGIQSGYDKPAIDLLNIRKDGIYYYIFKYLDGEEYRLVAYKGMPKKYIWAFENEVFLNDDGQEYLLNDYWKLLSTKVIQYGAGVIDLYFKEVEKAKNNFVPDKNKNFLGQLFEAIKDFYNNLFNNQLKEELNLELERENSQVDNFYNKGEEEKKREEFIFCGFQTNKKPILETLIINEVAWMGDFESYNNEWIELKNISNNSINLKGYQIIDQAEQIKFIFKEDKILKPKEFIVLKRGRDYSGILANTNEGLRLFDSDCNLLDEVFAKPNWPAGNNEDKKTMERNQEFIWLDSLKALGTPGKENSVYFIKKGFDKEENKEKEDKKTKNDLNVKKEDLTEENEKEENLNTNFVTSSTSSSFDIKKDKNLEEKNKICSFNTHLLPTYKNLIINEVAWMGDFESYNNEWIELKNISGRDLDITNYQLIDQNEQIKFTFSNFVVKKDGFVLLKRSPANFLKDVKEDFVYSGALANSNEGLRLFDSDCNLLDEVFAKPNWPAGNNQTKKTMERRNDFTWQNSLNFGGTPKRENSSGEILENKGISDLMVNNKSENDLNNISNLKILINQVKIMPVGERMIELYNPNEADIDLTNWYLQRKTKTSDNFVSLVSKNYFENKIIPKKGFLLISRINIADSDIIVNNLTLSDDNVIQLKNKDGQVVDKVGWGEVGDYEGSSLPNFSNFVDTDNNFNDFEIINCFIPKSSSFTCNLNENNKFLGTLAKKIVISEVKLEGEDKNDEFIELYNPLDEDVDLSNFSLQYKSNASDIFSTTTIFKKNFLANQKIKAKGFFLIARGLNSEGKDGYLGNVLPDLTYRSFALSSNLPGGTIFLVNNQEIITGLDDENIVDFVNYEKLILKGYKNFERKTFLDGYCYSAQKDYEFLGNSCLENEADYFDFRDVPRPQNFFSLVEPREKPVVQDFNIVFNSSTLSLEFSWSTSSEDVIYQVDLVNDNSSFVFKTTTLNNFSERIYEIGKEFNFSLKAIDAEGLSSDLVYKNIYVPSFLEKVYFYKKNYKGNDIYLIDLFYKQYPFIIYDFYQPKALVFYLNKATVTPVFQFDYDEYVKYYANFKVIPDASLINYHPCYNSGNLFDFTFYNKISSFLPLPNTSTYFCSYGWDSSFYKNNALDLNHIVLALASVPYELTNQDYLNIAFYNLQYFWSYYSSKTYDLIAIDRSKYYYQEEPDYLLDFKPITFLNYDILNVDNENKKAKIKIYWNKDETIFTLDGHIDYFYNFNNSEEWQNIITDNLELEVDLNKNYVFKLKAQDNLNRIQEKTLDVFISSDIF